MAFGVVLLILDLAMINTLTVLWFGIAAIAIGCIQLLIPGATFGWLIALWAVLSLLTLFFWLFALKPRLDRRVMERLPGVTAIVTRMNKSGGLVRLQRPVGGRDLWPTKPLADAVLGSRVIIESVDNEGTVSTRLEDRPGEKQEK